MKMEIKLDFNDTQNVKYKIDISHKHKQLDKTPYQNMPKLEKRNHTFVIMT